MKRLLKYVLIVVLFLMSATTLYLVGSDVEGDIDIITGNYNNLSTKTHFQKDVKEDWIDYVGKVRNEYYSLESTPTGGNLMGNTGAIQNPINGEGGSVIPQVPGSPILTGGKNQDLRGIAMQVSSAMMKSKDEQHIYTAKTCDYGGCKKDVHYYNTSKSNEYKCIINGRTVSLKYRCCTTTVYGILSAVGDTVYPSVVASNPWSCTSILKAFNSRRSNSVISATGKKYKDVNVGDVLISNKHTEIVVYKDGNKVYTANGGSCNGIVKTAQQGYGRTFSLNANVSDDWTNILRW